MLQPIGRILKAQLRALGVRRPSEMWARLRRLAQKRVLAHRYPKFMGPALSTALDRVGIATGATVFVHSAWDEFYNFEGKPIDLIRVLQEKVGPTGTIAMPAYPLTIDPAALFDARRTPTGAGLVPETFRRLRDARRGVHIFHSVAAVGPNAEYLVGDHHRSLTTWDRHSPYARLAELDATILCLGLPRSFGLGTCMHCPESLLYEELPYFKRVFGPPLEYRYRDQAGREGVHRLLPRTGRWRPTRVLRHIDPREVRVTHVSNVRLQAISARYLVDRMVELARRGIVNYYWPWPSRRLFRADG
ncbi:MAG: AAC(3) family N-acetyltransferase [Enhydrobacter sp.]|nr:MAG: AAC(3) family N-acetyltransferase [Enhydrobacter sp.]